MSNAVPTSERSSARLFATTAITLTLLFTATLVASELAAGMFRSWNDARLAPSAGLLHGYDLYYAPGERGPIWSWIYGPIAPLVYLPAVLFPTPASALGVALAITAAIFLASARALLQGSSASRGLALEASFAALVLYSLAEPALRGAGYWVHADAPAIGFAALACAAIATPTRRARNGALALSALAGVLAVATKQVLLPLPIALGAYLAWVAGRSAALKWLGWTASCAFGVAAVSAAAFGWTALVFNTLTIPLAHPWQWGGGARALATSAGEFALRALPLIVLLGFDLHPSRTREQWRDHPRTLLLVVALALALGGVLTRVKVGASVNAHAFALFFLAVCAAGALADACASAEARRRAIAVGVLGCLLTTAVALGAPTFARLPEQLRSLPQNPETTGFELARGAPGAIYFPSHPLVMLYAEERASHVSYGLYDRDLAGHPVPLDLFDAFTAPRLERVALWATRDDYVLRRLPGFTQAHEYGAPHGWWLIESELDHSLP